MINYRFPMLHELNKPPSPIVIKTNIRFDRFGGRRYRYTRTCRVCVLCTHITDRIQFNSFDYSLLPDRVYSYCDHHWIGNDKWGFRTCIGTRYTGHTEYNKYFTRALH